jgi:hypothetical protein
MRILRWISALFFASIFLRVIFYFGYRAYTHHAFHANDAVLIPVGLLALWVCYYNFKLLFGAARAEK